MAKGKWQTTEEQQGRSRALTAGSNLIARLHSGDSQIPPSPSTPARGEGILAWAGVVYCVTTLFLPSGNESKVA